MYLGDSEGSTEDAPAAIDDTAGDDTTPLQPETSDAVDGVVTYQPVVWHWFYLKEIDKSKRIWKPFSMLDSVALEDAFQLRNNSL